MEKEAWDQVAPEDERLEESRFWEKYWEAVRRRGVKPGKEKWCERHCARFSRWLQPRRLREAVGKDATDWLGHTASQADAEPWKVRQADKALRILFQDVHITRIGRRRRTWVGRPGSWPGREPGARGS